MPGEDYSRLEACPRRRPLFAAAAWYVQRAMDSAESVPGKGWATGWLRMLGPEPFACHVKPFSSQAGYVLPLPGQPVRRHLYTMVDTGCVQGQSYVQ